MDAKQERKDDKRREHVKKVEDRRKRNAERPGLFGWLLSGVGLVVRTVFAPVFWMFWLMKWGLYLVIGVAVAVLMLMLFVAVRWAWPRQRDVPSPPVVIQLHQPPDEDQPN